MPTAEQLAAPSLADAETLTMRAIVHRRYGTPDLLTFEERARPVPGENEVLVRVQAAGANVGDLHIVTGTPYLIRLSPFGGFPRPRHPVPGATLSGRVEAVGAKVTTLKPGDEVFGQAAHGAFAEYAVVPARHLAPKPDNLTFEQAAAVPWGATALMALRRLEAGQRVLINGASGGVGTWAVQIAKARGALVTAVCSTRNVELVRSLGADEVIDYSKEDFVTGGARFDLVLDLIGNRSVSESLSVLVPKGAFVPCSGGGGNWVGPLFRMVALLFRSIFTGHRLVTFVMAPDQDDLQLLKKLVEAGQAKPIIERTWPLGEAGEALQHVHRGHARGQIVVTI
jgi:NADPH:quinone reductase-like Zn-dependent oxidoreductase